MSPLRTWLRRELLLLFLVTSLLAACGIHPIHSETEMMRHAEEFVAGLDLEILEEDHQALIISWFDPGSPTSSMYSLYEFSNSTGEVKQKLRALYPAGDIWLEFRGGEWLGEAPLDIGLLTPEEAKDYTLNMLLQPKFIPKLKQGSERLQGTSLLLICPWLGTKDGFSLIYADAVALTEERQLWVRLHASGIARCHAGTGNE